MRILISTVTSGSGHVQAAAALEEAWRALRPEDEVEKLDVLEFAPRLYRKIYSEAYLKLIEHAPELYAAVFKKTDNPRLARRITRVRRRFSKGINRPFIRRLRTFRPDVVFCTHYLPLGILGKLKADKPDFAPFTVCVVTDFEAHALWMEPSVDLYCVAAEETEARLVARGVLPETVSVTGIPIAAKFSQRLDLKGVRKRLGLRDDIPILLVLGGGFGLGPVAEMLEELDKVTSLIQLVVVTGTNEELRRELAWQDRVHPTRVVGFVNNVHELVAISELILTKPGGLTSSEALALGKPLVILNPIPGQEAANSDFLLERGAAIKVNRVEDLSFRVEKLLGSKKLMEMKNAAKALGRPQAATDICLEVARRLGQLPKEISK